MKILISGASGLTGQALGRTLQAQGHSVARLVRPGGVSLAGDVRWDPLAATIELDAIEGTDAVVHLSGARINKGRWTAERKAVLRSSRIDTTRMLVDSLSSLRKKPRVFVSASAIGCYGDRGDEILTESSAIGTDFLSLLVRDWEAEASRAEQNGIRSVLLRFGVILSKDGGALPQMLLPFKFGLGGRLGTGKQWMSWIALDDAVGIICSAISNDNLSGPLNVVTPNPLTNADFTRIAAAVLDRPAIFAAPAFALRLALGEMAGALLLASQRVIPERLLAERYRFHFAEFESALRSIIARTS
jgi:uncharacterized protein (TIGR01777 family)